MSCARRSRLRTRFRTAGRWAFRGRACRHDERVRRKQRARPERAHFSETVMVKSKQGAKRVKSVALMAAAAMTAQIAVGVASVARGADVMIGTEWTPVVNENGHTYFSGFTDYNGGIPTTTLQQVARN